MPAVADETARDLSSDAETTADDRFRVLKTGRWVLAGALVGLILCGLGKYPVLFFHYFR